MLFWRISGHASLDGLGAELSSGRWHTAAPEKRVVYLAEHPAVALLENLVNLTGVPEFLPDNFQLLKIAGGTDIKVSSLTPGQLATVNPDDLAPTQRLGDTWIADQRSALLRVPSIPAPESWNYLMNPRHPEAAGLTLEWARPVAYDKRLFHFADA